MIVRRMKKLDSCLVPYCLLELLFVENITFMLNEIEVATWSKRTLHTGVTLITVMHG